MKYDELPGISVIVPTRNCRSTVCGCLRALAALDYPPDRLEVIVVDDASTDGTDEAVRSLAADLPGLNLRCLRQSRSLGPGEARNLGVSQAEHGILAFTEADVVADRMWLRRGAAYFALPQVGGVEGKLACLLSGKLTPFSGDTRNLHGSRYSLGNMLYLKELFALLGGFDPRYSALAPRLHGREGLEFALRVLEAGWEIPFAPEAVCCRPPSPPSWGQPFQQVRQHYFDSLLRKQHPEQFRRSVDVERLLGFEIRRFRQRLYSACVVLCLGAVCTAVIGWFWLAAGLGSAYAAASAGVLCMHLSCRKLTLRDTLAAVPVAAAIPYVHAYYSICGMVRFRSEPPAPPAAGNEVVVGVEELATARGRS